MATAVELKEVADFIQPATAWLERQVQTVPLEFVPAGSAQAAARFPALVADATLREMHVVDDAGRVWRGHKAWLLCLWALPAYRGWSLRLAAPGLEGSARRFVAWVARNRCRIPWEIAS